MTSFSPAAQAVINSTAEQVLADRRIKIEHIAAAALQAAADQVVPVDRGSRRQCNIRAKLRAIAAELNNINYSTGKGDSE
jgi:hypothetical protein